MGHAHYEITEGRQITSLDEAREVLTHLDLLDEVAEILDRGDPVVVARALEIKDGYIQTNSESLGVVFASATGRAGVAWGGTAWWTDADSVSDALNRYFDDDDEEEED